MSDNAFERVKSLLANIEMKLPFNKLLTPMIRPYFGESRLLCQHPTFAISIFYTYFYGTIGFFLNANHLRKHLGEFPVDNIHTNDEFMVVHDLKIIATSMGVVQYACLLVGCLTENPALFLPHLAAQLLIVLVKILNLFILLAHIKLKTFKELGHKVFAIILMSFNWCQEFCVFRRFLCICDL